MPPSDLTDEELAVARRKAEELRQRKARQVELDRFVASHNWAVTTEAECLGLDPNDPTTPRGWAIYDQDEDDPPIAVCAFQEDADRIVAVLRMVRDRTRLESFARRPNPGAPDA